LEDPGRFLKGIYDIGLPLKFIVSGSSSLEVRSKVFESLVGMKRVFYLWPFSFKEYLSSQSPPLELPAMDASETTKRAVLDKLYEFLVFGGYPRVVLAKVADEKIQLLNEIYSSYVEKDIVGLLRISDPLLFTRLVTLLASQVGGLVNLSEIGNTLRIDQRKIEAYIAALENTFIVRLVRPYSTNIRKELAKMPKVYFVDAGLRNFSLRDFRRFLEGPDKGKLLENFVFTVLVRRSEGGVNFWRTKDKAEVNFVVRDYLGNVIPIEVKALSLGDFRIPNGLRSFIKRYRPKRAFVVNLSMGGSVVYGDTEVSFILPYELESIDITSGTTY
jgi:predicted AAA+ superfamily ATPase